MKLCVKFGLAIQDYMFLDVDTKYVHWLIFGDKKCYILVLEDLGWIQVFLKNF